MILGGSPQPTAFRPNQARAIQLLVVGCISHLLAGSTDVDGFSILAPGTEAVGVDAAILDDVVADFALRHGVP